MGKKEKLLKKLFVNPVPKDFRWTELVTLTKGYGFINSCQGGSHYMFEHNQTGLRFRMSKTHPGGILKIYQVKDARMALQDIGVNDE
ncbi:MAG: type II toxin-antitoxin system HicA family toxin [Candidatus Electrothrix sp. AR1]|nr:type II toxin-antitoxin system HicA family toxin [Candidatus Electrothrix sp. AR1]